MVPNALETCETATIFVRLLISFWKAAISISSFSFNGIILSLAPLSLHTNCHGTMFEWCSSEEIMISSPALIKLFAKPEATIFNESVAPLVKIISFFFSALINWRTVSLASSNDCVASWLN